MNIEIIIPCYNEAKRLPKTLKILEDWGKFQKKFDNIKLVFANDGSSDETLKVMKDFKSSFFEIKVLNFKHRGYISTLFDCYINSNSKIICNMEADCSVHPKNFEKFVDYLKNGYDVVQGERILIESDSKKKSFLRKLLSGFYKNFFKFLFKCNLNDPQIGFKMFKSKPLNRALKQIKLKHDGLKVSELICRIYGNNGNIKEIPVDYAHDEDSRLVPKFSITNPLPIIKTILGCYAAVIHLFLIMRREKTEKNVTRF